MYAHILNIMGYIVKRTLFFRLDLYLWKCTAFWRRSLRSEGKKQQEKPRGRENYSKLSFIR